MSSNNRRDSMDSSGVSIIKFPYDSPDPMAFSKICALYILMIVQTSMCACGEYVVISAITGHQLRIILVTSSI